MTAPIISLKSVQLTLDSRAGPVSILNGVGLEIEAGQSVAIVGPSGSGKTSLLMVMAGLERATSGEVRIAGHDFQVLGEDALARVRGETIGIVFQSFHLVPTMTALENVALPLEFAGRTNAEATARARLEEVGLSHRLDHFPRSFQAASSSVWHSRVRCPSSRSSFSPMSRRAIWMDARGVGWSTFCLA